MLVDEDGHSSCLNRCVTHLQPNQMNRALRGVHCCETESSFPLAEIKMQLILVNSLMTNQCSARRAEGEIVPVLMSLHLVCSVDKPINHQEGSVCSFSNCSITTVRSRSRKTYRGSFLCSLFLNGLVLVIIVHFMCIFVDRFSHASIRFQSHNYAFYNVKRIITVRDRACFIISLTSQLYSDLWETYWHRSGDPVCCPHQCLLK